MAAEKNLARFLSVNFMRLAGEVLAELPRSGLDLDRIIVRLRHSIWGDNLTVEEKRTLLFGTEEWDRLPMAVLAARHLVFPAKRVPKTRKDLEALCRWLLARDQDSDLIDAFVRGWAGEETPATALEVLLDQLWQVRTQNPEFFAAVVRGQHGLALEMIVARRRSEVADEVAISILNRMALIWAAFDCQVTAARARRSMTKPLGWLISGEAMRSRASTFVSVFRPIGKAMRLFVNGYRSSEEERARKPRSRLSAVADIRWKAKAAADDIELARGPFALNQIVQEIMKRGSNAADPFLQQVSKDKIDSAFGGRQMSQFWYADLLPLQIVGMVAMRLAQMEQQLPSLLQDAVLERERGAPSRD